jgi:hypothetical protein
VRIVSALVLLCALTGSAWGQGAQCRTSPTGTSSTYCASEAFVSNSSPFGRQTSDIISVNPQSVDCNSTRQLSGGFTTLTLGAASGYPATCIFFVIDLCTETRGKKISLDGFPSFIMYPCDSVIISNQASSWSINRSIRHRIAPGTLQMYIDAGGDDGSDCLAGGSGAASACATLQHVHDTAADNFDFGAGASLQVNVPAAQTFAPASGVNVLATNRKMQGCAGAACFVIACASATTSVFSSTNASTFLLGAAFGYGDGYDITINGCKLTSSGAGDLIQAQGKGNVAVPNTNFGASAGNHLNIGHDAFLICSSYTVSGSAGAYHAFIYTAAHFCTEGATVTFSAAVSFVATVALSSHALYSGAGTTWVNPGNVTAAKYVCDGQSLLNAGGAAASIPGTGTSTGPGCQVQ